MPIKRYTSTVNVKPRNVSARNIAPPSVNSIQYSAYIDPTNTKRYGTFKYGAKTYGMTTEYSVGQVLPKISTVEI